MNTSLDQFHDVITPEPIGLFPLAEGWYMLLALLCAVLLYTGIIWLRRYLRNTYRREALKEMAGIEKNSDIAARYKNMLELLRKTAMAAYGRQRIAALEGASWWQFLNRDETLFTHVQIEAAEALLYRQIVPPVELVNQFERACGTWITQHQRGSDDHV